MIGIAQMFAPLPGVSRSGLTIAAALGAGLLADLGGRLQPADRRPRHLRRGGLRAQGRDQGPRGPGPDTRPDRPDPRRDGRRGAGRLLGHPLADPGCPRGAAMVFFCILGRTRDLGPGPLLVVRRIAHAPARRLWTGPPARRSGSGSWPSSGREPAGLWIVPTPWRATRSSGCWDPAQPVARRVRASGRLLGRPLATGPCPGEDGPSWLSEPACRALFREAIDRRRGGRDRGDRGFGSMARLSPKAPRRIDEWTISERPRGDARFGATKTRSRPPSGRSMSAIDRSWPS